MFNIFKKKNVIDEEGEFLLIVEMLVKRALSTQSCIYSIFKNQLGLKDNEIRKIELTYFAASVLSYAYMSSSNKINHQEVLDEFFFKLMEKCAAFFSERIEFESIVAEYNDRYSQYSKSISSFLSGEVDSVTMLSIMNINIIGEPLKRDNFSKAMLYSSIISETILEDFKWARKFSK